MDNRSITIGKKQHVLSVRVKYSAEAIVYFRVKQAKTGFLVKETDKHIHVLWDGSSTIRKYGKSFIEIIK